MSLSLREPRLADAERIAELHVRSWQVGYQGLMPADFLAALEPAYRARQYRDSWENPDFAHVRGLVADVDGPLVGLVRYGPYRTKPTSCPSTSATSPRTCARCTRSTSTRPAGRRAPAARCSKPHWPTCSPPA